MSVTLAKGFAAGGLHCGVKPTGALDLAIVAADSLAVVAAVFTQNLAAAAPVRLSRQHVANGYAQAVVLNSGNANAGTGPVGDAHAGRMATVAAGALHCAVTDVLVCSTGPIGPQLPIDAVEDGIVSLVPDLGRDQESGMNAARAILTTDTFAKTGGFTHDAGWSIGGMAKGAAMIRPNMATMLAIITTDAVLTPGQARDALEAAVATSFNSLNIDGCTSTNDTVIILASGASGVTVDTEQFARRLGDLCEALARQMARDGEETTKVIDVVVEGAVDDLAARVLGLEITDSDLVRASFYGGDPNWGRVLQALGQAGPIVAPSAVSVSYGGVTVASAGAQVPYDRPALLAELQGDFTVTVEVGKGIGRARIISTDLTPGYVRFNGEPS